MARTNKFKRCFLAKTSKFLKKKSFIFLLHNFIRYVNCLKNEIDICKILGDMAWTRETLRDGRNYMSPTGETYNSPVIHRKTIYLKCTMGGFVLFFLE